MNNGVVNGEPIYLPFLQINSVNIAVIFSNRDSNFNMLGDSYDEGIKTPAPEVHPFSSPPSFSLSLNMYSTQTFELFSRLFANCEANANDV